MNQFRAPQHGSLRSPAIFGTGLTMGLALGVVRAVALEPAGGDGTFAPGFECVVEIDPDESYVARPWLGGWVPFQFADDINATERAHMKAGMDWWTLETGVKFVYRNGEPDFLTITRSTDPGVSYSSGIGRVGGEQEIRMSDNGWANHGRVAHELCHALGWHHEQSRPDRDDFVTIEDDNIIPEYLRQFNIYEGDLTFGYTYDYDSIMHYSACSFSVCSKCKSSNPDCRSITTDDPDVQSEIGQRDHLSDGDLRDVRYVYGSRGSRYVAPGGEGEGTLSAPFGDIHEALDAIPEGGAVLLESGIYAQETTFSKSSQWITHGGSSLIE